MVGGGAGVEGGRGCRSDVLMMRWRLLGFRREKLRVQPVAVMESLHGLDSGLAILIFLSF